MCNCVLVNDFDTSIKKEKFLFLMQTCDSGSESTTENPQQRLNNLRMMRVIHKSSSPLIKSSSLVIKSSVNRSSSLVIKSSSLVNSSYQVLISS